MSANYLSIFLVPFVISLALTPVMRIIGPRLNLVARPGGRRKHPVPVTTLGGIALFIAYLAGIGLVLWLIPPAGDDALRLRGVIIGTLIVVLGGLLDDIFDLSPVLQFAIQFAGAIVAIIHIVFIEIFTNPINGRLVEIESGLLVVMVTLIWIVGFMNILNWLDGLDGLAAGVGTIAALLFAWHSYRLGQDAVAAFPLALAGALLGFLPFNFSPARIFLGTSGAYLLGYSLATLSILSPAKIATALLVLAVPLLDGAWRIIDRIRTGRSPFYGDRGHLHFRLADLGFSIPIIVLIYYLLSLAFGLIAIFATGLIKLIMLLILTVLVLGLLVWLSLRPDRS